MLSSSTPVSPVPGSDGSLVPAPLVAVTVTVYVVHGSKPVSVAEVSVVVSPPPRPL